MPHRDLAAHRCELEKNQNGPNSASARAMGSRCRLQSAAVDTNHGAIMRKLGTFAIAIFTSAIFALPLARAAQESLKDQIAGTWKIISWETVRPDGQVTSRHMQCSKTHAYSITSSARASS